MDDFTTWHRRGSKNKSEYRSAEPSELCGLKVSNADWDAVYLVGQDGRTFIVALNGQDNPFVEYRAVSDGS